MRLRLAWTATALLVTACGSNATVDSTDVNEAKIFQHYSADFNAETKQIELFAQFALGNISGTTIRLAAPSAVTVDGQPLTLVDGDTNAANLIGTYYRTYAAADAPKETYAFHWTRTDGQAFDNTLTIAKSVTLATPAAGAEISRSADLTLSFDGADAQADETVYFDLVVDGTAAEGQTRVAVTSLTSGHQAVIAKADLANLINGPAKLTVKRMRKEAAAQANTDIGGVLFSTYKAAPVTVTVKD
jgi:hypothetical protein